MDKKAWLTEVMKAEPGRAGDYGQIKKATGVPALSPFHASDYWYLLRPITWVPDADDDPRFGGVTVPTGFVTDFASVPQAFWNVLPRIGKYTYAAIIHDYLYWCQPVSRGDADYIFKLCMRDLEVSAVHVAAIYSAVAAAGFLAWNNNTAARQAGEKRVLKDFPDNPLIGWNDWKKNTSAFAADC